jgi:TPR repeat protein
MNGAPSPSQGIAARAAAGNGEEESLISPDGRLARPTKLSIVVNDALRRWYQEAEREAARGDVVSPFSSHSPPESSSCCCMREKVKKQALLATLRTVYAPHHYHYPPPHTPPPPPSPYKPLQKAQALLGQMLIEGYGCDPDPQRGRELVEKAKKKGYRMQGVYCVI